MKPLLPMEYLVLLSPLMLFAGGYLAWQAAARARLRDRVPIACFRLAALALLLLIAFNPGAWFRQRQEQQDRWAILMDRSRSMAVEDVDGNSRWAEAARIGRKLSELSDAERDIGLYTFADDLTGVSKDELETMSADGKATDIQGAGRMLLGRDRAGKTGLRGVVILSDGRRMTDSTREDFAIRARSRNIPVYPLVLGGAVAERDISLRPGRRHYVAFAGQETKVSALVSSEGFGRIGPVVRLLDAEGELLEEKKILIDGNDEQRVAFRISPGKEGYRRYSFEVAPWEDEGVPANNTAGIGVSVLASKMRVMLVEGSPSWDTKFSTQLLRHQPNMHVTSVYRLSADRFFKIDTDVSNVSESETSIFPDTAEELALHDVVVFGKGIEYFLDADRIQLLRSYVRNQGGCVLFARGKPYSGRFPEIEFLEPLDWGDSLNQEFTLRPRRAGQEAGLFGELLPAIDDPAWGQMPSLRNMNHCSGVKTFSRVLAEGATQISGKPLNVPMIVARRYGKGMVAVINAEGLWQWDFFPSDAETSRIYKDLWVQLIHWMATYSEYLPGQQYALHLSDSTVLPDTAVRVRIGYRGRKKLDGNPSIRITHDGKTVQEAVAARSGSETGRWSATIRLSEPGAYRLEVGAPDGKREGSSFETLFVRPMPSEDDLLSADPAWLEGLAATSGGAVVSEDELVEMLGARREDGQIAETSKAVWIPAWDRWWLLLAIAALFSGEWYLRRRAGLM